MRGLALMDAETKGLLVSQLEYQLIANRHGFPPLVAPVDGRNCSSEGLRPTAGRGSPAKPLALHAEPSAKEQQAEAVKAMKAAIAVRLMRKTYRASKVVAGAYQGRLGFDFEYRNTSGKDIRAFTGAVVFLDVFDRELLRVNLTVDDEISVGKALRDRKKQLKVKMSKDGHRKLVSTEVENLRTRFEPESVLFADGTKLGKVSL
jgi:hypothetical protein